jgi:hypothetical protein
MTMRERTMNLQRCATRVMTVAFGLSLGVGFAPAASAVPVTTQDTFVVVMDALQDTFVRRGMKNRNNGAAYALRVRGNGANKALVGFDLEAVRESVGDLTLIAAVLELNLTVPATHWKPVGGQVDVHAMPVDWEEGNGSTLSSYGGQVTSGDGPGATWRCSVDAEIMNQVTDCEEQWFMGKPNAIGVHPWAEAPTDTQHIANGDEAPLTWDVTPDVAAAIAQGDTLSWALLVPQGAGRGRVEFISRELPGDLGPRLVLIMAAPSSQELLATGDTFIRQGAPNTNEGAGTVMDLRDSGNHRALVTFDEADLLEAVGSGSFTARLELDITHNYENWGVGRTVDAHALTSPWVEGTGRTVDEAYARGDGPGATWRCASDLQTKDQKTECEQTSWEMGLPHKPELHPWTASATDSVMVTDDTLGTLSWDVTTDVMAVVDGADFHGWLIRKTQEGKSGRLAFASREHPNTSGPRLIIETAAP